MNEIWKPFINRYVKDIYSISTLGRIHDDEHDVIMKTTKSTNGNLYVEMESSEYYQSLYKYKTIRLAVDLMMADTFSIEHDPLLTSPYEVIHKDGNLLNCSLDNLELVDVEEVWVPLDIKDTVPGMYELSSFGYVRNLNTGNLLARFPDHNNLLSVAGIRRTNGRYRNMLIKVLLATYFIPGKQTEYDLVRNINRIGTDVSLKNIEWYTPYKDDAVYPDEIWLDLVYPDVILNTYIVSSYGRVRNKITGQPMRPGIQHMYYSVKLMHNDNKSYNHNIHRLVCTMFHPNPDNLPVVNHIDGDKLNNHYTNLEWCTQGDNIRHAIRIGLFNPHNQQSLKGDDSPWTKTPDKVVETICELLIKNYGDIYNVYHELINAGIDNVSLYAIKNIAAKDSRKSVSDKYFSKEDMNKLKQQRIEIIMGIIKKHNNDVKRSMFDVNKIFPYVSLTELKKIRTRYSHRNK